MQIGFKAFKKNFPLLTFQPEYRIAQTRDKWNSILDWGS